MLDLGNVFCTAQNVFGNGTTVASTDWIDGGVAQNWGDGVEPVVEIIVTTSFAGGTSATFQLTAVDAAGANPVVLDATPAIPIAQLVAAGAGTPSLTPASKITLRVSPKGSLPASTLTGLRLQCVNTGNNTGGAITARLVAQAATQEPGKAHRSGY